MSKFIQNQNNECEDDSDEETNINQMTQINKDKKKKKKSNKQKVIPQSAMGKLIAERQKIIAEKEAKIKALLEEEERKIKEEEERIKLEKIKIEEEKECKRKAKQDKILIQKQEGIYKTKSEKIKDRKNKERLEQIKKNTILTDDGKIIMKQENYIINSIIKNENDLDFDDKEQIKFRSPLFTILGNVDTGKTTLLDNLRQTFVQKHESAGITQQIGITLLTKDIILKRMNDIKFVDIKFVDIKIPNLLLIDTPGHETFQNLRKIGLKLADLVIVIVDIVHGLEQQTIESIKMLINSQIHFIFAFNKIDRLYGWNKEINKLSIKEIISSQNYNIKNEFDSRVKQIQIQIMEQGLNCELYWNNISPEDTISIIPISAITGQGIEDLLNYIIKYSQTILKHQIKWDETKLDCTIMEITNIPNFGYTVECIIKNGKLSKGDFIKIQTNFGTICTQIKNILTIQPNKDSKDVSKYISIDCIKEASGIKIIISENKYNTIITGTNIISGTKEEYEKSCSTNLNEDNINLIKTDPYGIAIYTSSQGSLEALVQLIKKEINNIPISQMNIGNVMKKDLVKLLLINGENTLPENSSVLAFDIKIDEDVKKFAKENKINIFSDVTIYKLYEQYKNFIDLKFEERKKIAKLDAVFPCILKIIESNVFNKKNPIIMGVEILEGNLHIGTPLIILPSKMFIGKIVSIQINKKDIIIGKKGQNVCIKINNETNQNIMYDRHFTHTDLLYSNISKKSIDVLKEYFKPEVSKEDVELLIKLKKLIGLS